MAPSINRRMKQGSPPSRSKPLPGIAIGVFAVVAAGLVARRALRWKSFLESKKDQAHAGIPPLVMHDREIEGNGENNPKCNADGTIAGGPCKYAKLVADLEFLDDAKQDGLFLQKGSAEEEEVQDGKEEEQVLDGQILCKCMTLDGKEKKEDAAEEGHSIDNDGEISVMTDKIKATLTLDGSSVKALQGVELAISEEEEENNLGTVEEQDTGEDGDDDRSSAGQLPSPVLVNGRILDFFNELSELKDEPDLSTSGVNSLSDSLSECSMQEVSSAPVKPLVLADEAMETSWVPTKPHFVGALDQVGQEVVEAKGKFWSDVEKAKKERKLPEMEETFCPQVDKESFDSNEGFTDSIDELVVFVGKPLQTASACNDFSICDINEVNVEILTDDDDHVALEGEVSVKLNRGVTESSTINGKVLSDPRSLGKCIKLNSASFEQAAQALNKSAVDVLTTTSQKESIAESACINGKVMRDESRPFVGFSPVDMPNLQSAQQGACHDGFEINDKMRFQLSKGVPLEISHATVEVEGLVESVRDMPGLRSDGEITAQARGEDNFHVENLDLRDMPDLKSVGLTDFKKMQAGGDDNTISENVDNSSQNAANGIAFLKDANETIVERIDNPVRDSEALPNVESTHKLPIVEGSLLEDFIGEEPFRHSGGHGITTAIDANDDAENVGTEKEQLGSLTIFEDNREDHELSPRAQVDKVEDCCTSQEEDEVADFGVAYRSTDTKQQEIEEIFNDTAPNDATETACCWTSSLHTTGGITREVDQVLTKEAVGLQSRSTFSSRVLRYLPIEIALICMLVALVSFSLQYLEGSISYQQQKYATSE